MCKYCDDTGIILIERKIKELTYEFGYRCSCVKGNHLTNIQLIPQGLEFNLCKFKYRNTEV